MLLFWNEIEIVAYCMIFFFTHAFMIKNDIMWNKQLVAKKRGKDIYFPNKTLEFLSFLFNNITVEFTTTSCAMTEFH